VEIENQKTVEEYKNWVAQDGVLLNRYFDIMEHKQIATKHITKLHSSTKELLEVSDEIANNFVEIGEDSNGEKICLNKSTDGVYQYGWRNFGESYSYNKDGDIIDYHQDDVYGFKKIANSFNELLQELYCNGSKELEPITIC